jgi:hypothetical protein
MTATELSEQTAAIAGANSFGSGLDLNRCENRETKIPDFFEKSGILLFNA